MKDRMLSRRFLKQSSYVPCWLRSVSRPMTSAITKYNENVNSTQTVERETYPAGVRHFDEIPGPKGWPLFGTLFDYISQGGFGKIYLVNQKFFKEYGDIFKETLVGRTSVNICDPSEIEKVFRAEPKYPNRSVDFEFWERCSKERGVPTSMVFLDGPEWYEARKQLAPKMMMPKELHIYVDRFNEVADDAILSLRKARGDGKTEGEIVTLNDELKRWALESIGTFVFDARIGVYDDSPRKGTEEFIKAIDDMFESIMKMTFGIERSLWRFIDTKSWKTFRKAFNVMFDVGEEYVHKRIEELKQLKLEDDPNEAPSSKVSSLLTYLLLNESNTIQEATTTAVSMISAGVDTTSNALSWLLYYLGLNQDVQERLHNEILSLIGKDGSMSVGDLKKIPYLRSCLKESMRMSPPSCFNTRALEVDIELNGYNVPAGTPIQMSSWHTHYSEEYYDKPNEFRPERWLRNDGDNIHPFAYIPFGFGPRMCLGKRVAEMEIFILLSKIIQQFKIKYIRDEKVNPVMKLTLFPETPIHIHLTDRNY